MPAPVISVSSVSASRLIFFFLLVFKLDLICFNVIQSKKNTIRDGGTTAHAYTIDTVEMVYTVDMIYTVDIVYTVDMTHNEESFRTHLSCSNVSMGKTG